MNRRFDLRRTSAWLLSLAILAAGGSQGAAQTPAATPGPIRQIDHIMIRTGDPQELFAFFADTLKLPVAWPMTSPRAGVRTGGVGFGNVNVEAIQFPGQTDNRPRLVGFALEPSGLEGSLPELKRRGLTVGERRPLVADRPDGSRTTLWTNVTLMQFSDADDPANAAVHIFLSEYNPSLLNVEERRAGLQKQLVDRSGGPLGVVALKEVVIGATDVPTARRLWQRLLDPVRPAAANAWKLGNGPAIRLVPSAENRVQTLVVQVASLPPARAFLEARQLLGAESVGRLAIDPLKVGGLDIRLVASSEGP
jgi:catechol 2,3-dioxygenase-like lactoylglutathione lyase family enzyme